jgi:hypothetical protein
MCQSTRFIYIFVYYVRLSISLWIDVDSKQIYIYETSACVKNAEIIERFLEFNNILVVSWRSILLVEETEVP